MAETEQARDALIAWQKRRLASVHGGRVDYGHGPDSVTVLAYYWGADAYQAPPSMGFSRQECWSGLPFPSPGILPNPGTEPLSLTSLALVGGFFTISATWQAQYLLFVH